jgi:hypothetical protein
MKKHPGMSQFNADVHAIARCIDARQEELNAAYQRIAELEGALMHAQDALFWHKGDGFEIDGELDGRTVGEVITDALT